MKMSQSVGARSLTESAQRYARGQRTLARSARDAGVSIWEMMDHLRSHKISAQYDEDDLAHDLRRVQAKSNP